MLNFGRCVVTSTTYFTWNWLHILLGENVGPVGNMKSFFINWKIIEGTVQCGYGGEICRHVHNVKTWHCHIDCRV